MKSDGGLENNQLAQCHKSTVFIYQAALTKYGCLKTIQMCDLTVPGAQSPKRVSLGCAQGACRAVFLLQENSSHCLFRLLEAPTFLGSWPLSPASKPTMLYLSVISF